MDVHVPAAITRSLVLRGCGCADGPIDGTAMLDDGRCWIALQPNLSTQDEDLLA